VNATACTYGRAGDTVARRKAGSTQDRRAVVLGVTELALRLAVRLRRRRWSSGSRPPRAPAPLSLDTVPA
jgi:hypothetical protein